MLLYFEKGLPEALISETFIETYSEFFLVYSKLRLLFMLIEFPIWFKFMQLMGLRFRF